MFSYLIQTDYHKVLISFRQTMPVFLSHSDRLWHCSYLIQTDYDNVLISFRQTMTLFLSHSDRLWQCSYLIQTDYDNVLFSFRLIMTMLVSNVLISFRQTMTMFLSHSDRLWQCCFLLFYCFHQFSITSKDELLNNYNVLCSLILNFTTSPFLPTCFICWTSSSTLFFTAVTIKKYYNTARFFLWFPFDNLAVYIDYIHNFFLYIWALPAWSLTASINKTSCLVAKQIQIVNWLLFCFQPVSKSAINIKSWNGQSTCFFGVLIDNGKLL